MSHDMDRVVDWLDDVLTWLREPLTAMPVERVIDRLALAFRTNACSWQWTDGAGVAGMTINPPEVLLSEAAVLAEWHAGQHRDCHALTNWYTVNRSPAPQTMERVPDAVAPRSRRAILDKPLERLGLEHQLTIYYLMEGARERMFVVARDRVDFGAADLELADYIQRSLVTLDRQTQVLAREAAAEQPSRTDLGLTGRELAVLQLLSDGLSTRQAARRLACSPRTVEKHLQRIYRKLGVRDRVNAVRVARLAGAVVDRVPDHSDPVTVGAASVAG